MIGAESEAANNFNWQRIAADTMVMRGLNPDGLSGMNMSSSHPFSRKIMMSTSKRIKAGQIGQSTVVVMRCNALFSFFDFPHIPSTSSPRLENAELCQAIQSQLGLSSRARRIIGAKFHNPAASEGHSFFRANQQARGYYSTTRSA